MSVSMASCFLVAASTAWRSNPKLSWRRRTEETRRGGQRRQGEAMGNKEERMEEREHREERGTYFYLWLRNKNLHQKVITFLNSCIV